MTITFAFALLGAASPLAGAVFRNPLVIILSSVMMLFCVCAILASKEARRTVPGNYFWLLGATLGESIILGGVASDLTVASVLTSIMATCLSTVGLFCAALCSSTARDMGRLIRNLMFGVVTAFLFQLALLIFMFVTWSFNDPKVVFIVSLLMVFIVGIYIIIVLLAVIIKEVTDPEDYILAALRIYIELARLFFYMLRLFG